MGKLNVKHFVVAVTTFMAVLYVVCAFFTIVAPKATLAFFNLWFHGVDLTMAVKSPTASSIVIGLFTMAIATAAASAFFAVLWNYFSKLMEVKK